MITVKDSLHVMVENKITETAGREGKVVSPTLLTDGEMCVCGTSGIILNEAASDSSVEKVFVVQRQGTDLVWSPAIFGKNVTVWKGKAYSAPVEQVSYLGYDSVTATNAIAVISDNLYLLRYLVKDNLSQVADAPQLRYGVYKSDAAATQQEVADGLYANLLVGNKRQVESKLLIEMVGSGTNTTIGTGVGTITFTNGSKTILASTDIDDATGATVLLAGEYIKTGVATNLAAYKIASVDTTGTTQTAQLTEEYQGTTATIANATVRRIKVADIANFGIRFTGVARKFQEGLWKYGKTRFTITLQDFGTTQLATTVNANEGVGYGQWVAEQEWFAQGTEGKIERLGVPPPTSRKMAVDTNTYDILSIEWTDKSGGTAVNSPAPARKRLLIAAQESTGNGTDMTDTDTGVVQVLDDYFIAHGTAIAVTGASGSGF